MEEKKNKGYYVTAKQLEKLLSEDRYAMRGFIVKNIRERQEVLEKEDYEYIIKKLRNHINALSGNVKHSATARLKVSALLRLYKRQLQLIANECKCAYAYTGYEKFEKVIKRCEKVLSTKADRADKMLLEQKTLYSEVKLHKIVINKTEDKNEGKDKSVDRISEED